MTLLGRLWNIGKNTKHKLGGVHNLTADTECTGRSMIPCLYSVGVRATEATSVRRQKNFVFHEMLPDCPLTVACLCPIALPTGLNPQ